MSFWRMRAGRFPSCSEPRPGDQSISQTSPRAGLGNSGLLIPDYLRLGGTKRFDIHFLGRPGKLLIGIPKPALALLPRQLAKSRGGELIKARSLAARQALCLGI